MRRVWRAPRAGCQCRSPDYGCCAEMPASDCGNERAWVKTLVRVGHPRPSRTGEASSPQRVMSTDVTGSASGTIREQPCNGGRSTESRLTSWTPSGRKQQISESSGDRSNKPLAQTRLQHSLSRYHGVRVGQHCLTIYIEYSKRLPAPLSSTKPIRCVFEGALPFSPLLAECFAQADVGARPGPNLESLRCTGSPIVDQTVRFEWRVWPIPSIPHASCTVQSLPQSACRSMDAHKRVGGHGGREMSEQRSMASTSCQAHRLVLISQRHCGRAMR